MRVAIYAAVSSDDRGQDPGEPADRAAGAGAHARDKRLPPIMSNMNPAGTPAEIVAGPGGRYEYAGADYD
jgi:hypothetical protein